MAVSSLSFSENFFFLLLFRPKSARLGSIELFGAQRREPFHSRFLGQLSFRLRALQRPSQGRRRSRLPHQESTLGLENLSSVCPNLQKRSSEWRGLTGEVFGSDKKNKPRLYRHHLSYLYHQNHHYYHLKFQQQCVFLHCSRTRQPGCTSGAIDRSGLTSKTPESLCYSSASSTAFSPYRTPSMPADSLRGFRCPLKLSKATRYEQWASRKRRFVLSRLEGINEIAFSVFLRFRCS